MFLFAEDGEAKIVDDLQQQITEVESACGKTFEPS